MSALRAQLRRDARAAARYDEKLWPVVPGLLDDLSEETKQWSLAEAHKVLPFIPNTQVTVVFFELEAGLEALANGGWKSEQLDELRTAAAFRGTPYLCIATRQPRQHAHRTTDVVNPTEGAL